MCGSSDTGGGNATGADNDDMVPPPAIAAALVMIAAGIAIVASYGCGKIRAWRPEKTYVLHNQPQVVDGGFEGIPLDDINQQDESDTPDDGGIEGLDNGLSETLNASLLSSAQ